MINQTTEQATMAREALPAPGLVSRSWTGLIRFVRTKPLGAIGGVIVVLLVIVAALAPVLSPYDPRSTPAQPWEAPNSTYLLGADYVGRDVLSRLIYGARISLYSLMSLPGLLIALAIMAVVTPSLNTVILAIVIGMIAPVIRTVRSQVLSLRELDYVTAATAIGAPPWRIIMRHIVPNCFATYLVLATYYLGFAIIIESSLSFLGVGTPPDQPSWGGMLVRAASAHVKAGPWLAIFPGLAIFMVVMGFNLLGDALRDVFDPRLRGR